MCMKTCFNYRYLNRKLLRRLASYKVHILCVYYYCVRVNSVGMVVNFRGNQIFMDFVRFLFHMHGV